MTNKLRTLLAFSAIGISTAVSPAVASEFEPLHVTVPFAFTAGKASLPAGDYTVLETSSHTIMIRGSHGSAIVLGSAGDEGESDRNSLGFRHTQKGYYLQTVRTNGRPSSVLRLAGDTDR